MAWHPVEHGGPDPSAAMPGGFGTLDELLELVTWAQLGLHSKPLGLLDVEGYYAPLLQQIDVAVREGFVPEAHRALLIAAPDAERMLAELTARLTSPRS